MFERFTDEARRVTVGAQAEARELGHRSIGTGHLLLALMAEDAGTGTRALRDHSGDLDELREGVRRTASDAAPRRRGILPIAHIPFSKDAKKALELSLRYAIHFGHQTITAGHLLLGTLRVEEGAAVRVLTDAGVDLGALRATTERLTKEANG
ncbi:Clp protease N-terminal domain-containing protein [Nocardiopsis gilva]|nr:Clp protease N-terminal domain-containing protein [Nocardiopsis gilva]